MEHSPNLILTAAYRLATVGIFLSELRKLLRERSE